MPRFYADEKELLQVVKEHYMMERDGSEFEYDDVWNVVKKYQYFMYTVIFYV